MTPFVINLYKALMEQLVEEVPGLKPSILSQGYDNIAIGLWIAKQQLDYDTAGRPHHWQGGWSSVATITGRQDLLTIYEPDLHRHHSLSFCLADEGFLDPLLAEIRRLIEVRRGIDSAVLFVRSSGMICDDGWCSGSM